MSNTFDFKNEKLRQAIEFLELHPNEFTITQLADRFGLTYDQMQAGIRRGKKRYTLVVKADHALRFYISDIVFKPKRKCAHWFTVTGV